MSDDPKPFISADFQGPVEWQATVAPEQPPTPVEWGATWWPDIKQDSYWFGAILLIVGLLVLLVPCSFFRGIAGNIFAAGVVFILFASFKTLTERMKKSSNPKIVRFTKWARLRREVWK